MRISEFIQPNMVWADLHASNKPEVIREIAENISSKVPQLNADEIASVLINRENLGSTGIEDGVAIPHAKIRGLSKVLVAFGRSGKGIEFQAHDQKPTHLFFVLLAPENATATHLKILARLSRLLKESMFRERLMQAPNDEDIYKIIIDEDKKH
jgi:PTS system nitrogen regulatory IIA component